MSASAYLDTGVLGSYFFPEIFSDETEQLLQSIPQLVISNLTEVEFYSLAAKKLRTGKLDEAQVRHVIMKFEAFLAANHFQRTTIESADYIRSKAYLAELQTNLRTLDALHIAAAERLELPLITSDKFQADGAEFFGLTVLRVGIRR